MIYLCLPHMHCLYISECRIPNPSLYLCLSKFTFPLHLRAAIWTSLVLFISAFPNLHSLYTYVLPSGPHLFCLSLPFQIYILSTLTCCHLDLTCSVYLVKTLPWFIHLRVSLYLTFMVTLSHVHSFSFFISLLH